MPAPPNLLLRASEGSLLGVGRCREESKVIPMTRGLLQKLQRVSRKRGGGTARGRYISMREKIAKARRTRIPRTGCAFPRSSPFLPQRLTAHIQFARL